MSRTSTAMQEKKRVVIVMLPKVLVAQVEVTIHNGVPAL